MAFARYELAKQGGGDDKHCDETDLTRDEDTDPYTHRLGVVLTNALWEILPKDFKAKILSREISKLLQDSLKLPYLHVLVRKDGF